MAARRSARNEAMHLYTAANGWFLNAEDKLGTIEEGKLGDLVVLSRDYFDSRDGARREHQGPALGAERR